MERTGPKGWRGRLACAGVAALWLVACAPSGGGGSDGGQGGGGGEGGGVGVLPTPVTCEDGAQGPGETDVDCGGPDCTGCLPGQLCATSDDCHFGDCVAGTCACPEGFQWADGVCLDIDECAADACGPFAVCTNIPGGFECACPLGFEQTADGCADLDECQVPFACQAPNTVCVNTPGDYECQCTAGYAPVDGWCEDVDGCAEGMECPANSSCVDIGGPAVCACDVGYEAADGGCVDLNECEEVNCGANAECVNTDGDFQCRCAAGFAARSGACVDVDECADGVAVCGEGSACFNTVGGYDCFCTEGWVPGPDGVGCVDIDECELGWLQCRGLAFCVNTPGGAECGCPDGYFPVNGDECFDVNECGGQPCLPGQICPPIDECVPGAFCANTEGGYECGCPAGTAGDGFPPELGGTGCERVRSCAEILARDPQAQTGFHTIHPDGAEGPFMVHCDMTADGGVGYTMARIERRELQAGPLQQDRYRELCAAAGLELLVPRSRAHLQAVIAFNGGRHPNLVGVYPNADGAAGLSNYAGRCQGEPCSFYLSDLEGSNSPCGVFQPSGDTRAQDALYRRATACGDEYNDAPDGRVEQGGYVLCSTNDVGPGPARSCQEVLARGSVQNVSVHGISGPYLLDGDGDGPAEPYMGWCDQHTHGGGWDLAMQLSGEGWGYADPVWTNAALVPAEVVSTEAFIPPPVRPENGKYRPFLGGAVGAVMVRFQRNTPGDASVSILLEAQRPIASLLALFTDGGALRPAGRPAWFNALGPLLQENCLAEGVNLTVGNVPAARLGILGNNEPDCVSVDSMYGVGFNTAAVCPEFMGTAGVCARNRGSASTPAWLFVRGAR